MALIDFVFTRAGEATRTAQNGQIETVPANFPVVNFAGGELLGYYSQRAATNLFIQSNDFVNSYWSKSPTGINTSIGTSGIEANVAVSPDGTENASRVNFNVQSDFDTGLIRTTTAAAGDQRCSSIWVKGEGVNIGREIGFRIKRSSGGAATNQSKRIALTSEWVRIDASITLIADNVNTITILSSNEATSCLIYEAQNEAGLVPTSNIKTTGSAVTRPADVATASGLTLSPLSNVQFKANFPTDYPLVIAGLQATVSGYRTIRLELSPTVKTLFVDGVEADTDTGSYDWSGITSIELGHFDGGEQPNFEIADLRINE
jgi:hypothetical protein